LVLVSSKDTAILEANMALQQGVGIHSELLGPEAVNEIMPGLETKDLIAVAYEPESGYADPYLTVNAFAKAAKRHGATLFQNKGVTAIRFVGGKVIGVEVDDERFDAPVVINSAGAWGAHVAKMAGAKVPIDSCRIQVGFFRRPIGHEAAHPVVADFIHATYFRSETGGITLVGLIDPAEADAIVNPDNFKKHMDDQFLLNAGERLVRRYPAMEISQSTGGFASLYAITPDWHPIMDELPKGSGFFICSGFSGHGFKLGPAVGLMMADLVTGVSDPLFDAGLFRISRFADGDLVEGEYDYSILG
jgi:sarcosine oxidase subunit beta